MAGKLFGDGIGRLPDVDHITPPKKKFKAYPIGHLLIDTAEVRTAEGRLDLFVAIDRTSKCSYAELHERATASISRKFLFNLIAAVPYKIHTVLAGNALHFTDTVGESWTPHDLQGPYPL